MKDSGILAEEVATGDEDPLGKLLAAMAVASAARAGRSPICRRAQKTLRITP